MSGTAKIYNAKLDPDKNYIGKTFGGLQEQLGTYRLVDADDEVGIEIMVGRDSEGRLVQLPLTYRPSEFDAEQTLVEIEHSELGHRYVSHALGDPVAVRELIRTIVTADDGAAFSDGTTPALDIRGSGSSYGADAAVGRVTLTQVQQQSAAGIVTVNSRVRSFGLRMPRRLKSKKGAGADYDATRLHISAPHPEAPEQQVRVAELFWRDMAV